MLLLAAAASLLRSVGSAVPPMLFPRSGVVAPVGLDAHAAAARPPHRPSHAFPSPAPRDHPGAYRSSRAAQAAGLAPLRVWFILRDAALTAHAAVATAAPLAPVHAAAVAAGDATHVLYHPIWNAMLHAAQV